MFHLMCINILTPNVRVHTISQRNIIHCCKPDPLHYLNTGSSNYPHDDDGESFLQNRYQATVLLSLLKFFNLTTGGVSVRLLVWYSRKGYGSFEM